MSMQNLLAIYKKKHKTENMMLFFMLVSFEKIYFLFILPVAWDDS